MRERKFWLLLMVLMAVSGAWALLTIPVVWASRKLCQAADWAEVEWLLARCEGAIRTKRSKAL